MSDKYIIKNCSAIFKHPVGHWNCQQGKECQDCTDCVLKRIVEKCAKAIEIYANNNFYDDDRDRFMGESFMAEKILDLLDMQEIKDEQKRV